MKTNVVLLQKEASIKVALPRIEFFIDKLQKNEKFIYLKINHGFFDRLVASKKIQRKHGGKVDVKTLIKNMYPARGPYHIKVSKDIYDRLVHNQFKYFFDKKYNYVYLGISDSNGMKGSQDPGNGASKQRINFIEEIMNLSYRDFCIHGGRIRHWAINGQAQKLFTELNKEKYNVILIGPKYMKEYSSLLDFNSHVVIPPISAGTQIDDIIQRTINQLKSNKENVVLGSTALLGFTIADIHKKHNLTYIDIGRSFDYLVKDKIPNQPWFRKPIDFWKNRVKQINKFPIIEKINL